MTLSELRGLNLSTIGSWPWPAKSIVLALVAAAALGAGYYYESDKLLPQLDQARKTETELKQEITVKAAKAANLDAYQQQLDEMRQSFGAMLRQLPDKTEVPDLLVDISQAGLASGLEFELFKPQGETPKEFYAELPIGIRVLGDYHEFGNFVSAVAGLPRIVTLHDFAIKAQGKDSLLAMDVTAKTYRYIEESEMVPTQGETGP